MSYQNLPLASRDATWDASAADKRIRKWAGAEEKPNAKYAGAFMWHDSKSADDFTAYKLPFADVVDGTLKAVPRALFAIAAVLQGSRGGVDISAADKDAIKAHIEHYYAKMRSAFADKTLVTPWQRSERPGDEHRYITFDNFELRDAEGDQPAKIVGHAAVFNSPTDIGTQFREQVLPGAFADSIKNDDIRALFNHDPNYVLGRNKSGTLQLREDGKGLAIEITPPDTQWARDLQTSIKRGDITGMSYGFRIMDRQNDQSWEQDDKGNVLRTIKKAKVADVSPVTYPAYPDTDVAVRCLAEFREQQEQPPESELDTGYLDTLKKRVELAEIS